jgi:hypothetical protein
VGKPPGAGACALPYRVAPERSPGKESSRASVEPVARSFRWSRYEASTTSERPRDDATVRCPRFRETRGMEGRDRRRRRDRHGSSGRGRAPRPSLAAASRHSSSSSSPAMETSTAASTPSSSRTSASWIGASAGGSREASNAWTSARERVCTGVVFCVRLKLAEFAGALSRRCESLARLATGRSCFSVS